MAPKEEKESVLMPHPHPHTRTVRLHIFFTRAMFFNGPETKKQRCYACLDSICPSQKPNAKRGVTRGGVCVGGRGHCHKSDKGRAYVA